MKDDLKHSYIAVVAEHRASNGHTYEEKVELTVTAATALSMGAVCITMQEGTTR